MSVCKGCGKEIQWATTETGKTIPLDPKAPTYEVKEGIAVRSPAMVSHFSTCPKANDFSGKGAK